MAFFVEHQIEIKAPASHIWPWLMQMGTGRAGWYSHDWIDNLGRPSYQFIEPQLQNTPIGTSLNGLVITEKKDFQKLKLQVGEWAHWSFDILEQEQKCTVNVQLSSKGPGWLVSPTLGLAHNFMQNKQLREIKKRAERPFSPSSERNKAPILEKLRHVLGLSPKRVLEVGSGTGQHALYFCHHLKKLRWTPSDLKDRHKDILTWTQHHKHIASPVVLDLDQPTLPQKPYDAIYSANVLHIVSEEQALSLFRFCAQALQKGGLVFFYGPFKYGGRFTSESNRDFDQWLKTNNPLSGQRDFEWVITQMKAQSFQLMNDHEMPSNNRFLVFSKV